VYRAEDVREFGSCYCSLYVSQAWNEGKIPHDYVPECRPVEKILGPGI
jgi:ferredoxin-thioredoxin reductase catalytic chain